MNLSNIFITFKKLVCKFALGAEKTNVRIYLKNSIYDFPDLRVSFM